MDVNLKNQIDQAIGDGDILEAIRILKISSKPFSLKTFEKLELLELKYRNVKSKYIHGSISEIVYLDFESNVIDSIFQNTILLEKILRSHYKDNKSLNKLIPSQILLLLLPFLMLFVVVVISQKTTKISREKNLQHLYFNPLHDVYNLSPPSIDYSIFRPGQWELESEGEYSIYPTKFESNEVLDVRREFPEINEYLDKKKFRGLYSLCSYLTKTKEYDKEFQLLRYYLENCKSNKAGYDTFSYSDYYDYVKYNYVNFGKALIRQGRFAEAQFYLLKAWNRIAILDTEPNSEYRRDELNDLLLLNTFLNCENEVLSIASIAKNSVSGSYGYTEWEIFIEQNNYEENSCLSKFKEYMLGINFLKSGLYSEAREKFMLSQQTRNILLKDISLLCIARAYYWEYENLFDENLKDSNSIDAELLAEVRSEMIGIREKLKYENFISDIDYYMARIEEKIK